MYLISTIESGRISGCVFVENRLPQNIVALTTWWETTRQRHPSKVKVFNPNYCCSLASAPCYKHLSLFPSIHNSGISFSISPSVPSCSCSPMFPQRCTVCMKKGEIRKKQVELSSLFCVCECHVLCFVALAPPSFKNDAILLSLSNCVLPVFSWCRPLVLLPFLNNCIALSVRLYPTNTPSIPPPWSLSQQKPKRNWVRLEHLCTWKKKLAKHWISPRRKTGTDI